MGSGRQNCSRIQPFQNAWWREWLKQRSCKASADFATSVGEDVISLSVGFLQIERLPQIRQLAALIERNPPFSTRNHSLSLGCPFGRWDPGPKNQGMTRPSSRVQVVWATRPGPCAKVFLGCSKATNKSIIFKLVGRELWEQYPYSIIWGFHKIGVPPVIIHL